MTVRSVADHQEHRRRQFWRRMGLHSTLSATILLLSLMIGMSGYHHFEHMTWVDAFANTAMILSGMGPLRTDLTESGKIFAGVYALYSGLVVIAVTGLLLAPAVHRLMHKVHWDDRP
jgi:hypothetical protein